MTAKRSWAFGEAEAQASRCACHLAGCCSDLPAQPRSLCAHRLAECTELLRTLVLPRLRLRDVHALQQTCRALRETVASSGAELQQLALVRSSALAAQLEHKQALTPCVSVHGFFPAAHLASWGQTSLQQLNAIAGLHFRIRLGQPAITSLQVRASDLQPGGLQPETSGAVEARRCEISPSGIAAIAKWYNARGAYACAVGIGGQAWRCPLDPSTRSHVVCAGWSRDGQRGIVFSLPQDVQRICVSTFDLKRRIWRMEQPLPLLQPRQWDEGDWRRSGHPSVRFSGDGLLAASLVERYVLVVHSMAEATSLAVPTEGAKAFIWQPGTCVIVLVGRRGLARLELDPLPAGPVTVSWVPLADNAVHPTLSPACMAFAPEGVLFVACVHGAQSTIIQAFSPDSLACLASSVPDTSRAGQAAVWSNCVASMQLCVSRRAVAISLPPASTHFSYLNDCRTFLYRRDGVCGIGARICVAEGLQRPSFSPDGYHLLGHLPDRSIQVLDARNGSFLVRLPPAAFWTGYQDNGSKRFYTLHACWSSADPHQLHVKSMQCEGSEIPEFPSNANAVFSVLTL